MEYIIRNKSLITGKENLEHLYTFKDFPVFIGCIDGNIEKDILADMSFSICKNTGFIQLDKVLPYDVIYSGYHSEALGGVWLEHHNSFIEFIKKYNLKNVLEIGGSNGYNAKKYTTDNKNTKWTIIEPNPYIEESECINVVKGIFDGNTNISSEIDGFVHSHVLEHIYFPRKIFENISNNSKEGLLHIFSVPNLYKYLENKFTNCMNFEHTTFLTEYFIDYLLSEYGFEIVEKKYFSEHSIFYATKKVSKKSYFELNSKYDEYKNMFLEYINYNKKIIDDFNIKIKNYKGEIYIFGAHVFSQYLIHQGLNVYNVKGILDNSKIKQGKRLYGTSFLVFSPEILKDKNDVIVILKAGGYQEEIKKQLNKINKNIIIFE